MTSRSVVTTNSARSSRTANKLIRGRNQKRHYEQQYQERPLLFDQMSSSNHSSNSNDSWLDKLNNDDDNDDDGVEEVYDKYYQHNDSFSISGAAATGSSSHVGGTKGKKQRQRKTAVVADGGGGGMGGRIRRLFHFGNADKNKSTTKQKKAAPTVGRKKNHVEGHRRNNMYRSNARSSADNRNLLYSSSINRSRTMDIRPVSTTLSMDNTTTTAMGDGSTTDYHHDDDMTGEESTTNSVSSSTLLRLHVEQQKYNATHSSNMLRNILSADSSLSEDPPNYDDDTQPRSLQQQQSSSNSRGSKLLRENTKDSIRRNERNHITKRRLNYNPHAPDPPASNSFDGRIATDPIAATTVVVVAAADDNVELHQPPSPAALDTTRGSSAFFATSQITEKIGNRTTTDHHRIVPHGHPKKNDSNRDKFVPLVDLLSPNTKSSSSDSSLFSSLERDSSVDDRAVVAGNNDTKVSVVEVSADNTRQRNSGINHSEVKVASTKITPIDNKVTTTFKSRLQQNNRTRETNNATTANSGGKPTNNTSSTNDKTRARLLAGKDDNVEDNRNTKQPLSKHETEQQQKLIKMALSRPFGRAMLPLKLRYCVTVSAGEWIQKQQKWVYTITIARQSYNGNNVAASKVKASNESKVDALTEMYGNASSSPSSSFVEAITTRSLSDFIWLERALRYEFHGALLIPPLLLLSSSTTTATTTMATTNSAATQTKVPSTSWCTTSVVSPTISTGMPVESDILKNWMTDILNGIRGSGEVVLPYANNHVQQQTKTNGTRKRNNRRRNYLIEEKKDDTEVVDNDKYTISDGSEEHESNDGISFDVLQQSESLETFLYRKSESLDDVDIFSLFNSNALLYGGKRAIGTTAQVQQQCSSAHPMCGQLNDNIDINARCTNTNFAEGEPTLMQSLIARAAVINPFVELCVGPAPVSATNYSSTDDNIRSSTAGTEHPTYLGGSGSGIVPSIQSQQQSGDKKGRVGLFPRPSLPLDVLACSSRAIGAAASLDVQDSLVDFAPSMSSLTSTHRADTINTNTSSELAVHSELIEAEKDLMLNYRQTALRVIEKLNALEVEEEKVGAAWKRVANSFSTLFGYEKEVEHARLGGIRTSSSHHNKSTSDINGKVLRENTPFRKISKASVDDALRVMARQKMDRSIPSLKLLKEILAAYLTDINTIEPSVELYGSAIQNLYSSNHDRNGNNNTATNGKGSWMALATTAIGDAKRTALKSFAGNVTESSDSSSLMDRMLSTVSAEKEKGEKQGEMLKQKFDFRTALLKHEKILRLSLTTMCSVNPFRLARMAWHYLNMEGTQCSLMHSAASMLRTKLDVVTQESIASMLRRHVKEDKDDNLAELDIIKKLINVGYNSKLNAATLEKGTPKGILSETQYYNDEKSKALLRSKALDMGKHRLGRWNSNLAAAILEAAGVENPNIRVDETTKELRMVRKYAIGLRENLKLCKESLQSLLEAIAGDTSIRSPDDDDDDGIIDVDDHIQVLRKVKGIHRKRQEFLLEVFSLFSAAFVNEHDKDDLPKRSSASRAVLLQAGIDTSDPAGWIVQTNNTDVRKQRRGGVNLNMGRSTIEYVNVKDSQVQWLLSSLSGLIDDYFQRIELIEGYIYMELVGIQIEKHFSKKRATALSAFEKKTDITAAINISTRKRLPQLVKELQSKLDALGPGVCQTTVREAKEAHMESKNVKSLLHNLAIRRLTRARESSTERVVQIMSFWAKEEESLSKDELKKIGLTMADLERSVCTDDVHLALFGLTSS